VREQLVGQRAGIVNQIHAFAVSRSPCSASHETSSQVRLRIAPRGSFASVACDIHALASFSQRALEHIKRVISRRLLHTLNTARSGRALR
jgi:hypothetical protein